MPFLNVLLGNEVEDHIGNIGVHVVHMVQEQGLYSNFSSGRNIASYLKPGSSFEEPNSFKVCPLVR